MHNAPQPRAAEPPPSQPVAADLPRLLQVAREEGRRLQALTEGDLRLQAGMEEARQLELAEHYAAPGDQNAEGSGSLSASDNVGKTAATKL